ncbi:MAG: hypothetical protein U9P49_08550 [Thermodesulfobacteriota bacterium]|nr:hypothetical protein [Thermodesulfobacteriota bacterium]
MLNEKILARLHLEAILPNMKTMAEEDSKASEIAKGWDGSIYFMAGVSGPRATLQITNSSVKVTPGKAGKPDIVLFFPTERLMNNMFKGSGVGFPVPLKGFTKIKGLTTFMNLAKRMEEILKGDKAPAELKAKLMLNTVANAMVIIANNDEEAKPMLEHKGVTEFSIKDGHAVNIEFTGTKAIGKIGNADAPDLILEFSTPEIFLDVSDDKIDLMAAVPLGDIAIKGDLHMGEMAALPLLDKIGLYLQ